MGFRRHTIIPLLTMILIFQPSHSASNKTRQNLTQDFDYYLYKTSRKSDHASQVVSKIYNSFRQWFFTVTLCEFTYFENSILKYIENMHNGYPVLLLNGCPTGNKTKVLPKINIHGETAYVITADVLSPEVSEYVINALINTGFFKPRSALIFVLNVYKIHTKMDSYFLYTMKTHFEFLWSKSITSSVVMFLRHGKLKTYTYDYVFNGVKDISDVKNISTLLDHQRDNLHGRELRLSVFKKIYDYDDKDPVKCDSRLAQTIMKQLNASCKPLAPRDGNTVGDILNNGNATGVTADLLDGYTDLELNSRILKNSYYGYIDSTYPLTQDELCFMIQSARKQPTFLTIVKSISFKLLFLFMVIVVSMILAALLAREVEIRILNIKHTETRGTVVFDLLKCFIRQTVNIKFRGPVYKSLVLIIIIYSLIIDCVIDGIITSAITNPQYEDEVNTLKELYASDIILGVHNRHFNMFMRSLDNDTQELIKSKLARVFDKNIAKILKERNFGYALLLRKTEALDISLNPSNFKNGRSIYHIVSECPIPCTIVYGLRYGSPYLTQINKILFRLYQAGILEYWLKSEQTQIDGRVTSLADNHLLKKLDIFNLLEVFVVWIIGLAISFIVFVYELVLFWCKKKEI